MKCQKPNCIGKGKGLKMWKHSSILYAPELLDTVGEYHWACDACVSKDHQDWADKNLSKRKIEVINHD